MDRKLLIVGVAALVAGGGEAQVEGEEKDKSVPPRDADQEVVVERSDGEPDPFASDVSGLGWSPIRKISPARRKAIGQTVLARVELYDVKTPTVTALLDGWEVKKGAGSLRGQVLDLSKIGEAEVSDLYAATVEAGVIHTFESTREYIYPTEYEWPGGVLPDPPKEAGEVPENGLSKLLDKIDDTIAPTAFETRNTGSTLTIGVQGVLVEENTWDVTLAPESVELAGVLEWGLPGLGAKMPQFISFRSDTVLRVREGEWSLVCTQTPFGEKGEARKDVKRMIFLKVERAR